MVQCYIYIFFSAGFSGVDLLMFFFMVTPGDCYFWIALFACCDDPGGLERDMFCRNEILR